MPASENKNFPEAELPVRVYSAERKFGLMQTLASIFREFSVAHALGFRFAERSIKARYRQSVLGILWAFLPPVATASIWIILSKTGIINLKDTGVPYPVFVLTGTMLWSVFTNAILMPMQIMQANRNILVKINFPREALLVNAFYEMLFNACITFVIIIAELLLFQVKLSGYSLLFIPCVFLLMMLGMSIGLLMLPVSLLYKDVQFGLPSLLQFAMYLTPVVYAKPVYEGASRILAYNPVTPILTNARNWLLGIPADYSLSVFLILAAVILVLLLVGIILQRITVSILIERMGS